MRNANSANMASSFVKVRCRLCPHCNELISYKTFLKHRRLYYIAEDDHWVSKSSKREASSDNESPSSSPLPSPAYDSEYDDAVSPPHSDPGLSEDDAEFSRTRYSRHFIYVGV